MSKARDAAAKAVAERFCPTCVERPASGVTCPLMALAIGGPRGRWRTVFPRSRWGEPSCNFYAVAPAENGFCSDPRQEKLL